MTSISSIALVGQMVGDPTRAAMLVSLMDGRALTAGELARACGVAPSTASGHLGALLDSGLLALVQQGRHRYYRLASGDVAVLLETIMGVAGSGKAGVETRPVFTGPQDKDFRRARTCYDHLAGSVAVAIADRLQVRGHLLVGNDGAVLTADGAEFLSRLGMPLPEDQERTSNPLLFCRPCLDWSERRMHIGGAVGAALYRCMQDRKWVRRRPGTRILEITREGAAQLEAQFQISP